MANRLSRRRPFVDRRPGVLIVCEGEKTEPAYFKDLVHEEAVRLVHVEIVKSGGVPRSVVERAVEIKREAKRAAKRGRDANLEYDEVWCVFDVDEHPNLPEALDQAKANAINVALSNPCFELWILLHFQDQRGHIERDKVQSACRTHLPGYTKVADYSELRPHYADAVRHAAGLAKWQEEQGRTNANPSTAVHLLTERLRGLSRRAFLQQLEKRRE